MGSPRRGDIWVELWRVSRIYSGKEESGTEFLVGSGYKGGCGWGGSWRERQGLDHAEPRISSSVKSLWLQCEEGIRVGSEVKAATVSDRGCLSSRANGEKTLTWLSDCLDREESRKTPRFLLLQLEGWWCDFLNWGTLREEGWENLPKIHIWARWVWGACEMSKQKCSLGGWLVVGSSALRRAWGWSGGYETRWSPRRVQSSTRRGPRTEPWGNFM